VGITEYLRIHGPCSICFARAGRRVRRPPGAERPGGAARYGYAQFFETVNREDDPIDIPLGGSDTQFFDESFVSGDVGST
jgi:hypothetical protein